MRSAAISGRTAVYILHTYLAKQHTYCLKQHTYQVSTYKYKMLL
jgi:hypothetical protein